jgi:2,4-dienoyl-CoA reductase-like NADH-dependent reductase (Old Yellow Enzyme family)
MTECLADPETNAPNSKHIQLYSTWGKIGAGILITGNIMVDRNYLEAPANIAIEDSTHRPVLIELVPHVFISDFFAGYVFNWLVIVHF